MKRLVSGLLLSTVFIFNVLVGTNDNIDFFAEELPDYAQQSTTYAEMHSNQLHTQKNYLTMHSNQLHTQKNYLTMHSNQLYTRKNYLSIKTFIRVHKAKKTKKDFYLVLPPSSKQYEKD
ncbi:hypothetical protein AWW70_26220 [Bacillus mycoides]|uniref:Uncharacterized protein n=1 Tax=Bacillus mycoides TaxID=1405 RepID=A0A109FUA4_BACMY|nr:hypothetical protein [Bacillus mycoides]KWU54910.1 hypothetical protein AWW70_26220 [Bacillus mycoides]